MIEVVYELLKSGAEDYVNIKREKLYDYSLEDIKERIYNFCKENNYSIDIETDVVPIQSEWLTLNLLFVFLSEEECL